MKVVTHDTLEELRATLRRSAHADWRDRVRMVVYAREGDTGAAVAQRLGCTARAVRKWVRRYNEGGLAGLKDLPRSGRPRHLIGEGG